MNNWIIIIEGTDIQKLNIFDDSSTFSIKDQYDTEAKLVYGDTEKYQEFQANLEDLSDSDKKEAYTQFSADVEHIFHRIAQHQQLSPSSNEVQDLIGQWSRVLGRFMVCDEAILLCIAETYVTDERFFRYFDQFGEEGYLDFLHRSIVYFVKEYKELSES